LFKPGASTQEKAADVILSATGLGIVDNVGKVVVRGTTQTATKVSGAYFLEFQSGKMYVGKGLGTRMAQSTNRIETQFGDKLLKSRIYPTSTSREAFMLEHQLMMQTGQVPLRYNPNSLLYNIIYSPGKSLVP
jgi:hypothetical protein